MILNETFTLRNKLHIPKVGFGTWQITQGAYEAALTALKLGYRHIDTAEAYGNEAEIGRAIKASGIPRSELFITSKLPAQIKGYDAAIKHFHDTLKRLDLTYLDLYLIHAPWPWSAIGSDHTQGNIDSWKAFITLHEQGLIKSIGVSNFEIKHLNAIIDATGFVPHVNQVPLWISNPQNELRAFCLGKSILIEAYSPLATGRLLKVKEVIDMAEKYHVTPAQLCIRFCLELGTLPLPKSTHEERIKNNAELDFEISKTDVKYLLSLNKLF